MVGGHEWVSKATHGVGRQRALGLVLPCRCDSSARRSKLGEVKWHAFARHRRLDPSSLPCRGGSCHQPIQTLRKRAVSRAQRTPTRGASERLHAGQRAHDGVALGHAPRAQRQAGGHHGRQPLGDGRHRQRHGNLEVVDGACGMGAPGARRRHRHGQWDRSETWLAAAARGTAPEPPTLLVPAPRKGRARKQPESAVRGVPGTSPAHQPPSAGSLKRLMLMTHTSTQMAAITCGAHKGRASTHASRPPLAFPLAHGLAPGARPRCYPTGRRRRRDVPRCWVGVAARHGL